MLLAALLSAGFLAVVSGNLNQTARIADKTRAIEASRAGIAYANAQLSGSSPTAICGAPLMSARRQFQLRTLPVTIIIIRNSTKCRAGPITLPTNDPNYRNTAFAKFPAPNQASGDAPKFLVQRARSAGVAAVRPGQLQRRTKPSSRGRNQNYFRLVCPKTIPTFFTPQLPTKKAAANRRWASALRSISNWNFGVNNTPAGVPYATYTRDANTPSPYVTDAHQLSGK